MATGLTVITWNVQGRAGVDARAMADVLRRSDPDVVALQEVQRTQARAIAAALGPPWTLVWGFKHWPVVTRPEGVAVLSRHPLVASSVEVLRRAAPVVSRRRIALVADIALEPGRLRVASVHLSPEAGADDSRRRELARVAATDPGLVLGDLNVTTLEPLRSVVEAHGWTDCWDLAQGDGPTHWIAGPRAGRPPDHRLDYVLAGRHVRVERAQVPTDGLDRLAALSDHLPVTVRLSVGD